MVPIASGKGAARGIKILWGEIHRETAPLDAHTFATFTCESLVNATQLYRFR